MKIKYNDICQNALENYNYYRNVFYNSIWINFLKMISFKYFFLVFIVFIYISILPSNYFLTFNVNEHQEYFILSPNFIILHCELHSTMNSLTSLTRKVGQF